jgi:hypothetical protein
MFLDVNLVEHHILLLGIDVCFHLHGNMTGKDRQQEPLLWRKAGMSEESRRVCHLSFFLLRKFLLIYTSTLRRPLRLS